MGALDEPALDKGPVLVIGAKGLVGAAVTKRLVEEGRRVICVEPKTTPGRLAKVADAVELVAGDVRDMSGLLDTIGKFGVREIVTVPFYQGRSIFDEMSVMV